MQYRGRGANLQTNTSVILQMVKYSDYKRDLKVCPKEAYKQRHSEPGTASKDVVTFVLSTLYIHFLGGPLIFTHSLRYKRVRVVFESSAQWPL